MLGNGFTKKSVGTLTLGEKLKKLRSERRVSLGEISRITRIPYKYLQLLDEGMYEKLPADVYVKGFLRSYAEFFGIEERLLIKIFEKEKEIKKNLERDNNKSREKFEPINISSFIITPKVFAVALVGIIFLSGFFYIYKEIGSFSDAPKLIILNPEKNSSLAGNLVSLEGVTDKDAKVFINDQPILVDDDGKFKENLTVQSGVNIISVKSVNRFEKETEEKITVNSNYKTELGSFNEEEGENSDKEESRGIEIEMRVDPGPVWLSIESDGNLVFSGTMLTGATQIFKAENNIVINSGKGNATFVKFNGKDIGSLSDNPGAVRGVTFNSDTKY